MSEVAAKYRVKPEKVIFHGGKRFEEGAELDLVPAVAAVHADNIELVEGSPELVDDNPELTEEPKPVASKNPKSKLKPEDATD